MKEETMINKKHSEGYMVLSIKDIKKMLARAHDKSIERHGILKDVCCIVFDMKIINYVDTELNEKQTQVNIKDL